MSQYQELPEELSESNRTFARIIASLKEEAEAIGWYEQRLAVEENKEARSILHNAQVEKMKHFSMCLEFLFRHKPAWRLVAKHIIFAEGDIIENSREAEEHIISE